MISNLEYDFEQIHVMGEGLMADGIATLESAGEGYEGEFFVSQIKFTKGPTLAVRHLLKHSHHAWLFNVIATEIEASSHVQELWADHENGCLQTDPDRRHDERRDHQAMGWVGA
jgi:hypothetical protein